MDADWSSGLDLFLDLDRDRGLGRGVDTDPERLLICAGFAPCDAESGRTCGCQRGHPAGLAARW